MERGTRPLRGEVPRSGLSLPDRRQAGSASSGLSGKPTGNPLSVRALAAFGVRPVDVGMPDGKIDTVFDDVLGLFTAGPTDDCRLTQVAQGAFLWAAFNRYPQALHAECCVGWRDATAGLDDLPGRPSPNDQLLEGVGNVPLRPQC